MGPEPAPIDATIRRIVSHARANLAAYLAGLVATGAIGSYAWTCHVEPWWRVVAQLNKVLNALLFFAVTGTIVSSERSTTGRALLWIGFGIAWLGLGIVIQFILDSTCRAYP